MNYAILWLSVLSFLITLVGHATSVVLLWRLTRTMSAALAERVASTPTPHSPRRDRPSAAPQQATTIPALQETRGAPAQGTLVHFPRDPMEEEGEPKEPGASVHFPDDAVLG